MVRRRLDETRQAFRPGHTTSPSVNRTHCPQPDISRRPIPFTVLGLVLTYQRQNTRCCPLECSQKSSWDSKETCVSHELFEGSVRDCSRITVLRLGKPMEHLQAALKASFAPGPAVEQITTIGRQLAYFGYLTYDVFVWVSSPP